MVLLLHPYLVQVLQFSRSIQITPIETNILPPVTQPEALSGLHALQANLDLHGASEQFNNMVYITRQ